MRIKLILAVAISAAAVPAMAQMAPIARARQVTASYNLDFVPSPDGRRAVLIKIIGGHEQLFAMNLDGSGETQITRDDADHEDPAWSPDGRSILVYQLIELESTEMGQIARIDLGGAK